MPDDGETKNGYKWFENMSDAPDGWYSADGSYGGNGEEPVAQAQDEAKVAVDTEQITAQSLYEQETGETWPPKEPKYAGSKEMIPDKEEMRYWQTQAFAQRKAARDAKAAEAKVLEERTYKESQTEEERQYKETQAKAAAEAKQPSVNDTLAAAFERGQQSGDFTEYQSLLAASKPPTPAKTPTVDDLIMEAILASNNEAAMALWDFANMPSQAERLRLAIEASQSPADYLATVGMMRGEIPIPQQPAGSYRLGPESQAFAAYGVGGQGGGDQNGTGGGPLQDPALQAFIRSRGGGEAQTLPPGGQTALPGATQGQTFNVIPDSPALKLIDRQIQAVASAGEDTELSLEEQAEVQQRLTALQTQRQQVWQQQQSGQTTQTRQQSATGENPAYGVDPQAADGLTTEQRIRREAGLETSEGLAPFGPERDIIDPDNPNMIGVRDPYGTVRYVNKNDPDSVNWARNYTKPKPLTPNTTSNQAATGKLPSFLEAAYGKEALSGAALTKRLSYPELAERQGVTVPRFRSAQARSMQTPLEQRLFEAGLQQQGVDLPTWLAQERAGTTPGGSRRRRIQTGY